MPEAQWIALLRDKDRCPIVTWGQGAQAQPHLFVASAPDSLLLHHLDDSLLCQAHRTLRRRWPGPYRLHRTLSSLGQAQSLVTDQAEANKVALARNLPTNGVGFTHAG
jgi:hypothetical protein